MRNRTFQRLYAARSNDEFALFCAIRRLIEIKFHRAMLRRTWRRLGRSLFAFRFFGERLALPAQLLLIELFDPDEFILSLRG